MKLNHLPLRDPQPDARRLIAALLGEIKPENVPQIEFIIDEAIMNPVLTEMLGRELPSGLSGREGHKAWLDNLVEFWYRMGYDVVRIEHGYPFPSKYIEAESTSVKGKQRGWVNEHEGTITTWEEFERYPWPKPEEIDFWAFEYVSQILPEGMGLMVSHGGGLFEHLSWIMSYEKLCFALYDDPELVEAIAGRLGELMVYFYDQLLDLDRIAAVFPGDDFGFRTSTLISPNDLRRLVLPWHQKFAAQAHARGIPYFIHSCGNILPIMEDLIEVVKIDGKHSFEDAIFTAKEFQDIYGDRTAVLGGMDIHKLATFTPEGVRRATRKLIDACAGGRFAVGSGNSVPDYIPLENYLAMVDEALSNDGRP